MRQRLLAAIAERDHYLAVLKTHGIDPGPPPAPPAPAPSASGDHVDGQTAGVSAFLRGHDLKIQADYTHLRTTDVVSLLGTFYSPDSHRLRVSAQLMF